MFRSHQRGRSTQSSCRCDRRRPPAPCTADCPLRARLHRTGRRSWAERGRESRARREAAAGDRRARPPAAAPEGSESGSRSGASGLDDMRGPSGPRRGLPRPPPRRPQPSGAGTRRPRALACAPATIAVSANPGQTTLIAMLALERRRHAADEADDGVLRRRGILRHRREPRERRRADDPPPDGITDARRRTPRTTPSTLTATARR